MTSDAFDERERTRLTLLGPGVNPDVEEPDGWDGRCRMCGESFDEYIAHLKACPEHTD